MLSLTAHRPAPACRAALLLGATGLALAAPTAALAAAHSSDAPPTAARPTPAASPLLGPSSASPFPTSASPLLVSAAAASTVPAAADPATDRGSVVSAVHLYGQSRAAAIRPILALAHEVGGVRIPTSPLRHGVDGYRVRYRTVDVTGHPTTATGLVAIPRRAPHTLPTLTYLHGTTVAKADAPSHDAETNGAAAASYYASAGYAAIAPDYLGLGGGPGHHPYMDAPSSTTASIDLLRAARRVVADHGHRLAPKVAVTGFSQGGQVAMAVGRALQAGAAPGLRLAAVAPVSGPLDLAGAELPAALPGGSLDPVEASFYLGYLLTSWNRTDGLGLRMDQAFQPAFAGRVERLYDGHGSERAIFRILPHRLDRFLTPQMIDALAHPSPALQQAMARNDGLCSSWTPKAPVRLYAARGDRDVAILDSEHCLRDLHANGVPARLVQLGDVTHFPSAIRALPRTLTWFASLR